MFRKVIKKSVLFQRVHKTLVYNDPELDSMNELDENGWAHIHHAAFRGFVKSIERFVKANEEQLEFETGDDVHSTPLLLATMSGNLESVQCLVELGANLMATNSQNHGVVELSALKEFIQLLEYFVELNDPKLQVWKRLIAFLGSVSDEECESAGKCLRILTNPTEDGISPNWEPMYTNGVVPTIVKVIKSTIAEEAKAQSIHALNNILTKLEVKQQFSSLGGIPPLVRLLKSSNSPLIQITATALKELALVPEYAEQASQNSAIQNLVNVIKSVGEVEVLVEVIEALGNISYKNEGHQSLAGSTPGSIPGLVALFEDCVHKPLLMALTKSIAKIAQGYANNQDAFVNEGVAAHVIMLTKVKQRDLQLSAVDCIHMLAENNDHAQKVILEDGAVLPLMQLLKKSRAQNVQEKTAGALWALAGNNMDQRRNMASMMGVQLLIEFLSSMSEELHYIGSEGLGVLGQGPENQQTKIATANGIHPLVRLLRADKEHIVQSVIRSLRYLCVGVGNVPHNKNQSTVAQSRGIKFLVALMVHSRDELIQVESALALGCVALGHPENLEEIHKSVDFSYVRILKMMYHTKPLVRLMAGSALATFAYNNISQQREIAEQGGVRFSCFIPFLESSDEYYRCNAAYQVVVLARIIPDYEQAMSSAAGIKLIGDLLHDSRSDEILSLACDCVARLAHTRAGVPAAIVSIDAVNDLCRLMTLPNENVRGCAAIALGYLSYNHLAERQLLNRCRSDPFLMQVMVHYTKKGRVAQSFVDSWKHYKKVGLPPIEEGRPSLVARKSVEYMKDVGGRPLTIMSFNETDGSTKLQSSPTNLMNGQIPDDGQQTNLTGRLSRGSRGTSHSIALHRSNTTGSQKSHPASVVNEVTAAEG
ncbi:ankyrin and armadillo repeat-containing protein-like isoform X2 [Lineus longissimus]|uniref:ankyrin and armadillo repeat-containing protein-like isoform X2 n=1 Tax=Lineus longissimus TaxID=88925 RepID=UPI00315D50D9